MTSSQTQQNVSTKVQRAMEDLAAKGEAQRQAKAAAAQQAAVEAQAAAEAAELEAIRQARIARMKQERGEAEKNTTKGHGEVATISQDEFLSTVTGSTRCVVHFFLAQFEQCHVMDAHVAKLAGAHLETRFVRIDAEKAPFFVQRLSVRVLPSLLMFEEGKLVGRQTGFAGLGETAVLARIEKNMVALGLPEARIVAGREVGDNDGDDDDDNEEQEAAERRVPRRAADDDW